MPTYPPQRRRPTKTPPHVSLRILRKVSGLTLEQVAASVTEILGATTPISRGTLSAIETGTRGASHEMLAALEQVYGIDRGSIVTEFPPRAARGNGGNDAA